MAAETSKASPEAVGQVAYALARLALGMAEQTQVANRLIATLNEAVQVMGQPKRVVREGGRVVELRAVGD